MPDALGAAIIVAFLVAACVGAAWLTKRTDRRKK